jgi:CRISPR-associated endoribonuclease Cas6/Csy4 subtype I-F
MGHFFELNYASADPREQQAVLAKAWHLLHASAKAKAVAFCVSFPYWKDPVKSDAGAILRPGVFGPVLRVFAPMATLDVLRQEVATHRLTRSGLVSLSPVRAVPADACAAVAFLRSRASDRVTDAFVRRQQRRAARRQGGASDEAPLAPDPEYRRRCVREARVNFVALESADNGHRYSLAVERRREASSTVPNSFGLGTLVPDF